MNFLTLLFIFVSNEVILALKFWSYDFKFAFSRHNALIYEELLFTVSISSISRFPSLPVTINVTFLIGFKLFSLSLIVVYIFDLIRLTISACMIEFISSS